MQDEARVQVQCFQCMAQTDHVTRMYSRVRSGASVNERRGGGEPFGAVFRGISLCNGSNHT